MVCREKDGNIVVELFITLKNGKEEPDRNRYNIMKALNASVLTPGMYPVKQQGIHVVGPVEKRISTFLSFMYYLFQ